MESRIVLCAFLLHIVVITAGSDVITYNQAEMDVANDDSLFKEEQFLRVKSTFTQRAPQSPANHIPQGPNQLTQSDQMGLISGNAQAGFSDLSPQTGSDANTGSFPGEYSDYLEDPKSKNLSNMPKGSQGNSKDQFLWEEWKELSNENDEYLFMSEGGEGYPLLSRGKRQAGSGEITVDFRFVILSITLPTRRKRAATEAELEADIETSLKEYLEFSISTTSVFTVSVTSLTQSGSDVIVVGELYFDPADATRVQIARALDTLDKDDDFKIDGDVYAIGDPTLEPSDSPSTQRPALCFLCEVYEKCVENSGVWVCSIDSDDFYPHGTGDSTLPTNDELASVRVDLSPKMTYDDTLQDRLFISVNGFISFETEYANYDPVRLPDGDRKLVAPYWTDLDYEASDVSEIYYKLHLKTDTSSSAVFTKANADVVAYSGEGLPSFDATSVLIVTWVKVPPYIPVSDSERVTFQCVIISDGQSTYAYFAYLSNGMNLDATLARSVEVGWGDTNLDTQDNYYIFDEIMGNTGAPGRWMFKIGFVSNSQALCLNFLNDQTRALRTIDFFNLVVPPCPCNELNAIFNPLWVPNYQDSDVRCYDVLPLYLLYGRRCCYRNDNSFSFENRQPQAGNFQAVNPLTGLAAAHDAADATPKRWCCYESELCDEFYRVRPVRGCTNRNTRRGNLVGDPHVTTLDQLSYIFNGLGEYTLLDIVGTVPSNNVTVDFKMQGRTCLAKTKDGAPTKATVWCALALRNTNGTSVHVEISDDRTYLVIYMNEQDYSARFRDNENFNARDGSMFIQKINGSLSVSTPDHVGVTITLTTGLLDISPVVDEQYKNMTSGLLGNFNDKTDDEYIMPNGTQLPAGITEREVFSYGQTWAVTDANSVFRRKQGQTAATFFNSTFEPIYLDEASDSARTEAETVCGGVANLPCIFDYIATNDTQVALGTLEAVVAYTTDEAKLDNRAPVIEGNSQIRAVVNETFTFQLNSSDPDNNAIVYELLKQPASNVFIYTDEGNGIFRASFTPSDLSPVQIQVVAADEGGLQSEVQVFDIVVCSNCSDGRGACNYTTVRRISDNYAEATCVCETQYSGLNCEKDKDGCANRPCPEQTTCTDLSAEEELATGKAYNCSDCPDGLRLNPNNSKCEDVDECMELSPCPQNSSCTNNLGSYTCKCDDYFRMNSQMKCVDIDQCTENSHSCAQICINEIGGFSCDCYPGFVRSGVDFMNCTKIEDADPCANLTDECEYGCLNDSGSPKCFCQVGFNLAPDGKKCVDDNECDLNLCSQFCNNTEGSYMCSCYPGYTLAADRLDCESCPSNFFGVDCKQRCECRGRAERCDNTRGCICNQFWTGPNCETDVDECETVANICPDDKQCRNTNGSYVCECPVGFTDTHNNGSCYDVNECLSAAVHNCPQDCVNNPGSYACRCKEGYIYVSANNSCIDINECETALSGCQHICVNQEGSFNCECYSGFVLQADRKTCLQFEEVCASYSVNCSYACRVEGNDPKCYCPKGFELSSDGYSCIDVVECQDTTGTLNKCTDPDTCTNSQGSYTCDCPAGSELQNDKRTCQACDDYHWGENCANECSCNPKGTRECNKVIGCVCLEGYLGVRCDDDIDECAATTDICNSTSANCINTQGSYICQCLTGYQKQLDGSCKDIDECDSSVCDHKCNNTMGSYICSCYPGFRSEGDNCFDIDECAVPGLNECEQLCRNTEGSFACECFSGFRLNTTSRNTCLRISATECVTKKDNCSHSCVVDGNQETCICPSGFVLQGDGFTCEDVDECLTNPCVNAQECKNEPVGSFSCVCANGTKLAGDKVKCQDCDDGFFGEQCAQQCICDTTHGNCSRVDGTCNCFEGWTGVYCDQDVDECTRSPDPVQCGDNSYCVNAPGSYRCECNIGFFRTGAGECTDCDATHYGQDCAQTCQCEYTNTLDCDNVNGACTCQNGWNGTLCTVDFDECTEVTNYCSGPFENCSNLNGSAECLCITGYARPDVNASCQACDSYKYGDNCQNDCTCVPANTASCSNVYGNCTCNGFWEGVDCSTDIDECQVNQNLCDSVTEQCQNNVGAPPDCLCVIGYERPNATAQCQACDATHYGQDCNQTCQCEYANTLDCDNGNGTCTCKVGWGGSLCTVDIHECQENSSFCSGPFERCNNLNGSAECLCKSGYERPNTGDDCEDVNECLNDALSDCSDTQLCVNTNGSFSCQNDVLPYNLKVTLGYRNDQIDPDVFDNTTAAFRELRKEIEAALLQYGVSNIGPSIARVMVVEFRNGSVIALGFVQVDETKTNNPPGDAAALAHELANANTLTVNGAAIPISSLEYNNIPVTPTVQKCDLLNCPVGTVCQVISGKPNCTEAAPDSDSDRDLIIGLSVGLPLFLLLTIIIAILVCLYVRRKRSAGDASSTPSVDRDAPFRSVFATQVATKGSWGAPSRTQMYSPDAYSEAATSESSGDGHLLKSRNKGRSDFQDSPWYDNRGAGASPRERESRGGAPTETTGPTSNFSWEYMFRLLEPHRDIEIPRPNVAPNVNEMYTPGRSKKPDSMA